MPSAHDFGRIPVHAGTPAGLQPKLAVNVPGGPDEQEAERVAAEVARAHGPEPRLASGDGRAPRGQDRRGAGKPVRTRLAQPDGARARTVAPVVRETIGSPGRPLEPGSRELMESRFGHDFGRVRVHTDAAAARAAEAVQARACTIGRDVVFGSGEYSPSSAEGRRLLAHELAHVVQQRAAPARTGAQPGAARFHATPAGEEKGGPEPRAEGEHAEGPHALLQRSAVASWTDASDAERAWFLSAADRKKYLKQQERLQENRTVKSPVQLPQVQKIMTLSANYHHYDQYPTPEGGTLAFDASIVKDVQKQFRMGAVPDFWPNIKWKGKDGQLHDIGVRFSISFIPHALDPAAAPWENYAGMSMLAEKDVQTHPQDNVVLMRDIDNLSKLGVNTHAIVDFADQIGVHNFVYDDRTNSVTYTPSAGGAAQTYQAPDDVLTVIRLVRAEAKAQHLEEKLKNDTLGYASESAVTFDTNKTAPASKSYNAYRPMEGVQDYTPAETAALSQQTQTTFTPAQRRERLVAVVTHEIGHNLGMGHTDFGVMSESAESDVYQLTATTLKDTSSTSSGTTVNMVPRLWEVSLDSQVQTMTPENVQLLVNRVQAMTSYVLPLLPTDPGAQKPTLQDFSKAPIAALKPLLKAEDYGAVFADDQYVSMLAIPYQPALLDELASARRIEPDDKGVIRGAMAAEGRLSYAAWQKLSTKAHTYIKDETLRLIDKSFSGVSFFSSAQERDAY